MRTTTVGWIVAMSIVAATTGCGGGATCESLCNAAEAEGCGGTNCESECARVFSELDRVECDSEREQVIACSEENVCASDVEDRCRDAFAEATGCLAEYCVRNPTDEVCDDDG